MTSFASYYNKHVSPLANSEPTFDCRAFVLPWEDVPNYFIWRYRDWLRNSVSMFARSHFSHKECHGKNVGDLKAMLIDIGKPWESLSDREKNGFFFSPIASKERQHEVISLCDAARQLNQGKSVDYQSLAAIINGIRAFLSTQGIAE